MINLFEKHGKKILIGLMVAYLFLGLKLSQDYGIYYDEPIERITSFVYLKYYLGDRFKDEKAPQDLLPIPNIKEYSDNIYGAIFQLPSAAAEYFLGLYPTTAFQVRHISVFLIYFTGLSFFLAIIKNRFKKWLYVFFAMLLFVLTPRFFAESFYNNKDIVFFSAFIICWYFLQRLIRQPSYANGIYFGCICALSANTRIAAAGLLGFALLYLVILIFKNKSSANFYIGLSATIVASFTLLYFLATPGLHANPVAFFSALFDRFNIYGGSDLFMGDFFPAENLPRSYYFVWLGITTPIGCLVLFIIGLVIWARNLIRPAHRPFHEFYFDLTFIGVLIMIWAAILLYRPVMYNGWRHFYFTYASILYAAVMGFVALCECGNKAINIITCILTSFSLLLSVSWITKNHPYEYVYFNFLAREKAYKLFELDYWRLTTKELIEIVAQKGINGKIEVWDYFCDSDVVNIGFSKNAKEKIPTTMPIGYVYPADYIIANYTRSKTNNLSFPFFRAIEHIEIDGMRIASVFERNINDRRDGELVIASINANVNPQETALIFDNDKTSGWHYQTPSNGFACLEFTFNHKIHLYGISLIQTDKYPFEKEKITFSGSSDGANWFEVPIIAGNSVDFLFSPFEAEKIRMNIEQVPRAEELDWTLNEVFLYEQPQ